MTLRRGTGPIKTFPRAFTDFIYFSWDTQGEYREKQKPGRSNLHGRRVFMCVSKFRK